MPDDIRTSASHPLQVAWLLSPHDRIGLTLAPGQHRESTRGYRWARDLDADLQALVAAGVTVLVGLLEERELKRALADLYPRAAAAGLEVLRLPIADGHIPEDRATVDALLEQIEARVAEGKRIVIHCMGGLGRTGTIAGCYLMRGGLPLADVLAMLAEVRDPLCPENSAQRAYIAQTAPATAAASITRRNGGAPVAGWFRTLFGPAGDRAELEACALGRGEADKGKVDSLLEAIEREVSAAPEACFSFADGVATLKAAGRSYAAGTFTTPTLGELRGRLQSRPHGAGRLTLSALTGTHRLSDIGTLQGTAGEGELFQVASQFDCLEAPDACVVPVRDYLHDCTQGPRASVSAFPGTFLRHYQAPADDGSRFVQTEARCLNLLKDVFGDTIARVKCGYLQASEVREKGAFADALEERFDLARVGVHDEIDVVFGHDWSGPVVGHGRIAQVLTSTIALGGYGRDDGSQELARVRRQLLRVAYLGTLLAAADLGKSTVLLTLIGGGVFGNPMSDIWDAIYWAADQTAPLLAKDLAVVVNSRPALTASDKTKILARGGAVVELAPLTEPPPINAKVGGVAGFEQSSPAELAHFGDRHRQSAVVAGLTPSASVPSHADDSWARLASI